MADFRVIRPILKTVGDHQKFELICALLAKIEAADTAEAGRPEFSSFLHAMTPGQRHLYAVNKIDMEVNHGGFEYYFRYSGTDTAPEAIIGLRAIGSTYYLSLLQRGMSLFKTDLARRDVDQREIELEQILEQRPEVLEAIDDAFFKPPAGTENVEELLLRFIADNEGDFILE